MKFLQLQILFNLFTLINGRNLLLLINFCVIYFQDLIFHRF